MKVMILAAGRGERMRPLTDKLPKPMLPVSGRPLIEHHIEKLKAAGFSEFVINTAWLADKITAYLGDGRRFGVSIQYSNEGNTALETAGGICQALPLLVKGNEPFLVVNGDTYIDYAFDDIPELAEHALAHIWLVENPVHHPLGDFCLQAGRVSDRCLEQANYTFSGMGMYRASLFDDCQRGKPAPLAPVLRNAMYRQQVTGSLLAGKWVDVGTPERLAQLNKELEG